MTLNPVQQDELLQKITERLVYLLPLGWHHVQLDYRALGDHVSAGVLLRMADGGVSGWPLPDEVVDMFTELRTGMARPERGTWVQVTYWLTYPDNYQAEYNRDKDPGFATPPPPEQCRRELERFPRSEEHVPDWLRDPAAQA